MAESMQIIEKVTCEVFEVDNDMVKQKSRKPEVLFPRQVILTIAYFVFKIGSMNEVSSLYEMNHATLYNCKKSVEAFCSTEPDKRIKVEYILSRLKKYVDVFDEELYYRIKVFEKSIEPLKR